MTDKALVSWSGGKDSCYALMQTKETAVETVILLNVLNEEGKISRSHGIPHHILAAQANAMNKEIYMISSSWEDYEIKFTEALIHLKKEHDLTTAIFGDIDLQEHKDWEEKVSDNAGLQALLPLWKRNRKELIFEMLGAGIVTMIVSCNTTMGENYLGKIITISLVGELEEIGIDPCGENGEFHTLVLNAPIFNHRLQVEVADKQLHNNYWFAELEMLQ